MVEYFIKVFDCSHKFIDNTRTHVGLFIKAYGFSTPIQLGYVFTELTPQEVLENQEEYIDIILNVIKDNIKLADSTN